MKIRALAVTLLAGGLVLSACGDQDTPGATDTAAPSFTVAENVQVSGSPTFDEMKSQNRVIIGVKEDQPGLGYKDPTSNKYTGFDIDIARLIATQLGFSEDKIQYKAIASAAREQALINGDVDYYVGTYTINERRKEQVAFAGPYFTAGQDLLVRKDDNSITGPETLKGKRVCSVTGSTPVLRVKEQQLTDPDKIVELQTYSQCVVQLTQGQVDVVTTDDAILKGYAAQEPDTFKVVGKTFSEEPYGVGLPRDDTALRAKINDILQAAIDDGTWQKIYDATLGKSGSPAEKPVIVRY